MISDNSASFPVAGRRLELDCGRLVPVDAADDALVLPGHRLELVRDLGRHRDVDAVVGGHDQVRRLGRGSLFSGVVRFHHTRPRSRIH